jgi:Mg-chelatase subunit ChlD
MSGTQTAHTDTTDSRRAALRTSEQRRADLERKSRRRTRQPTVRVEIDPTHPTAHIQYDANGHTIVITGREVDQPVTEYDGVVWDRLVQTVFTLHENAHALYTDWEDRESRVSSWNAHRRKLYGTVNNAFEDARINRLILDRYKTYVTAFLHVYANYYGANAGEYGVLPKDAPTRTEPTTVPDDGQCAAQKADGSRCERTNDTSEGEHTCWQHDDADATAWADDGTPATDERTVVHTDETRVVSLQQAIQFAALDLGGFDSGKYKALLDPENDTFRFASAADRETYMTELRERTDETVRAYKNQDNSAAANALFHEYFLDIEQYLSSADFGEEGEASGESGEGEGEQSDEGASSAGGFPDDSERSEGTPVVELDPTDPEDTDEGDESGAAPGDDEGDEDGETAQAGRDGEDSDDEDEDTESGPSTSGDEDDESDDSAAGEDDDGGSDASGADAETDEELAEQIAVEIERESTLDTDGEDTEEQKLDVALANAQKCGLSQQTLGETPNHGTGNPQLWAEAVDGADRIRAALDLPDARAIQVQRNQRRGAVDGAALARAYVDNRRNYKRSATQNDTPEVNFALVLDRSTSMKKTERRTAITGVAQFLLALEPFPYINVMVVELYSSEVRLVKPFDGAAEDYRAALTHDGTAGGTPLSDVLALVRERLEMEQGANVENRMLVVTDGKPGDTDAYNAELRKASFPVVGISIRNTRGGAGAEYYHRHQTVPKNGRGLTAALEQIARELTPDA